MIVTCRTWLVIDVLQLPAGSGQMWSRALSESVYSGPDAKGCILQGFRSECSRFILCCSPSSTDLPSKLFPISQESGHGRKGCGQRSWFRARSPNNAEASARAHDGWSIQPESPRLWLDTRPMVLNRP